MSDSDMMNYVNVAIDMKQNYEIKLNEITKKEETYIIKSYNSTNNELISNFKLITDVCKSIQNRNRNNLTLSIQNMFDLIQNSDYLQNKLSIHDQSKKDLNQKISDISFNNESNNNKNIEHEEELNSSSKMEFY